ncbi:PDDEXK-like family protein [Thorsellia kenyensis]|uniref:PD-(D/E)XK nuclease family protein n=1 Tax=Thorsellia kenyensis TaxID=1549888 RepID=A0ABV6CBV6_9GAMM
MRNANNVGRLLADPRFGELLYLAKTNSDIFEVLNLTENQHSDMLQWMFNSREGHGLGDSVFKDFMIAIHDGSEKLDGRCLTSAFRQYWTPARIRASSFSDLYFFREMATKDSKNRVDIVIVDSTNRIIIVVENKTKSKPYNDQLDSYYKIITNARLDMERTYQVAFVLLDMSYYDTDNESESDIGKKNEKNPWAKLNYSWLEAAAARAEQEYNKGNPAASVLMSYCRMVTDWYSEDMSTLDELAIALNKEFPEEVALFKEYRWSIPTFSFDSLRPFLKILDADEERTKCIEISQKYPIAIEWLINNSAFDVLLHTLSKQFSEIVKYEDECMNLTRKKLEFRLPIHVEIPTKKYWPLYVLFRYDDIENKYTLEFRWMKSRVISEYCNLDKIDEIVNNLLEANHEFRNPIFRLGIDEAVAKFGKLYSAFSGLSE